jgi:hypothetical protein
VIFIHTLPLYEFFEVKITASATRLTMERSLVILLRAVCLEWRKSKEEQEVRK